MQCKNYRCQGKGAMLAVTFSQHSYLSYRTYVRRTKNFLQMAGPGSLLCAHLLVEDVTNVNIIFKMIASELQ